jgi:hypothetical protein
MVVCPPRASKLPLQLGVARLQLLDRFLQPSMSDRGYTRSVSRLYLLTWPLSTCARR